MASNLHKSPQTYYIDTSIIISQLMNAGELATIDSQVDEFLTID